MIINARLLSFLTEDRDYYFVFSVVIKNQYKLGAENIFEYYSQIGSNCNLSTYCQFYI